MSGEGRGGAGSQKAPELVVPGLSGAGESFHEPLPEGRLRGPQRRDAAKVPCRPVPLRRSPGNCTLSAEREMTNKIKTKKKERKKNLMK